MSKLWSMFFLSVLLVAALNWYAIEREPDIITIDSVHEHVNEVVRVEGRIISWIEDPYGQGEQRLDVILEDDTGVIEIRWYKFGKLPTIGSTIQATGDVIEWNGRFWIQSLGNGAVQWSQDDVAEPTSESLTEVALDPSQHVGHTVRLQGYLTKTIQPDATWSSLYLADHPNYANTKHQLKMYVSSSTGNWVEAGSKITVVGEIHYEERDLRYVLYAQGPEILVDYSVLPHVASLDWEDMSTWVYDEGKLVQVDGTPMLDSEGLWWIEGSNEGQVACIIPSDDSLPAFTEADANNSSGTWSGRLVWSGLRHMWCVDGGGDEVSISVTEVEDLLGHIASDPTHYLETPDSKYTIQGYMVYSLEPGSTSDTSFIGDGPDYQSRSVSIKTIFDGARDAWLEAGQALLLNVSVGWNPSDGRLELTAHHWDLNGPTPSPISLSWNNGPLIWGYSSNMMVSIDGVLNSSSTSEGGITTTEWWLERPGTSEKLCINPQDTEVDISLHNFSEPWIGRLIEIENRDTRSMQLCISAGYAEDSDDDGLSDTGEASVWGTDPYETDSDGDGHSDRAEVLAGSDPLDEYNTPY